MEKKHKIDPRYVSMLRCMYLYHFFFLAGRPERRGGIPTKREKNIRKHVRHHIPRKPYGTRQQAKMTDNLETEKSEKALLLLFFFFKKKRRKPRIDKCLLERKS